MIRQLTEQDIAAIIGTEVKGYVIENAKIKTSKYIDSDHYGILLGNCGSGGYVTWQFHYDNDEQCVYWGHYMDSRDAAVEDFETRDLHCLPKDEKMRIWNTYLQYLRDWADLHTEQGYYGATPACFDEWLDCEFQENYE